MRIRNILLEIIFRIFYTCLILLSLFTMYYYLFMDIYDKILILLLFCHACLFCMCVFLACLRNKYIQFETVNND